MRVRDVRGVGVVEEVEMGSWEVLWWIGEKRGMTLCACALLVWPGGDCADCGCRRCSKEGSFHAVLREELPPLYAVEH